jgi:hypothetical protein
VQRYRELERSRREAERLRVANAKEAEKLRASQEVSRFENYLELLVSLHKDSGDALDWHAQANTGGPQPPPRGNRHEAAAVAEMQAYEPGFLEKLFGGDKKRHALLANGVARAREVDDAEYGEAVRQYQAAYSFWSARRTLAARILAGDVSAYAEALEHVGAFDEIAEFKTRVTVKVAEADTVVLACEMTDADLVPREEVKLTAAGRMSTRAMPAGRYWALYQDHVCSCALRAANEAFAVLPVSRVIVNIGAVRTNSSTGHDEPLTFLAVHFAREVLANLNVDSVDPSDSMRNFPHRMKFKKTTGFEPVPPITADEQWVTT